MKVISVFLLFLFAILMVGCKPEAAAEASQETESPEELEARIAALSQERAKLLNQKQALMKKLGNLISTSKLDPTGEVERIKNEQQIAMSDLHKVRSTHPSLMKLNEELRRWQSAQMTARKQKKPEQAKLARKRVTEISSKLHDLSNKLPAIREANDQISNSQKQLEVLRRKFAEKSPEGKVIVDQINEIEAKLNSSPNDS